MYLGIQDHLPADEPGLRLVALGVGDAGLRAVAALRSRRTWEYSPDVAGETMQTRLSQAVLPVSR